MYEKYKKCKIHSLTKGCGPRGQQPDADSEDAYREIADIEQEWRRREREERASELE